MEQYSSLFFNKTATQNANSEFKVEDFATFGNIVISTTEQFNGSTATIQLFGSNDGRFYAPVYQDDNKTLMKFTLASNKQYTWYFRRFLFRYYKVSYTAGDTTDGTLTANFLGKNE